MKTKYDLPDDLIVEILSRVPITSLSALRSTCKSWNSVSKTQLFGKKAARNQQFLGFILTSYRACSLRFYLQGICNKDELFVDPSVKKICKHEDVLVSRVSQCDGLLLCGTKYLPWLFVWNPYLGETRWILPSRNNLMRFNTYALGYDDNCNHKILRVLYDFGKAKDEHSIYRTEIYNLSSNAWRVLDVNPDWEEPFKPTSDVSLKGNTYFLVGEGDHLHCFDFTAERFGPRLPLPFKSLYPGPDDMSLSSVRDEKLVLLYNHYQTSERLTIWISTKIEPNVISWSMLFKVNINNMPLNFPRYYGRSSFFIHEEKKVLVLFLTWAYRIADLRACIVGEDGIISYVNIEEALNNHWDYSNLVVSSYVPILV